MILFKCAKCGNDFKVPDDAAGKTGKCIKCGTPCVVPGKPTMTERSIASAPPTAGNSDRLPPPRAVPVKGPATSQQPAAEPISRRFEPPPRPQSPVAAVVPYEPDFVSQPAPAPPALSPRSEVLSASTIVARPSLSTQITCPHCRHGIADDPRLAGKTVECPSCGGGFQMPLPAAVVNVGQPHSITRADVSARGHESAGPLAPSPYYGKVHVITEQTAKRYKAMQAFGCLGSVLGIIVVMSGIGSTRNGPSAAAGLGALTLLGGLVIFIWGRILAWWHHGRAGDGP